MIKIYVINLITDEKLRNRRGKMYATVIHLDLCDRQSHTNIRLKLFYENYSI